MLSESFNRSADLGDGTVMLGDGDGALVTGGGSIVVELDTDALCPRAGSGNAGISSPAEEVSMAIFLVLTVVALS